MNDMQRDLDELGRRLWPRTDALRPAPSTRGALGRTPGNRGRTLNLLAAVAVVAVVVAIVAVPIVLGRFQTRHTTSAVPPQPTAKVSPRPPLHLNGQIVMGVDNILFSVDPPGRNQLVLLYAPAVDVVASPAYTRDGTKLAFMRGPVVDSSGNAGTGAMDSIWVFDTKTRKATQLTTCRGCSSDDYMSWSPDGSRLAFSEIDQGGSRQLYLIDADGTHRTQLTHFPAAQNATQPSWSPDGTRIAFTFFTVANSSQGVVFPTVDIDVISPDGTGLAVLLAGNGIQSGGTSLNPAWSPDGSRIAYLLDPLTPVTGVSHQLQLWLMEPDGSHRSQTFLEPNCCVNALGGPTWSPDGTQIALVAAKTLWLRNADGGALTSEGANSSDRPAWQPVP